MSTLRRRSSPSCSIATGGACSAQALSTVPVAKRRAGYSHLCSGHARRTLIVAALLGTACGAGTAGDLFDTDDVGSAAQGGSLGRAGQVSSIGGEAGSGTASAGGAGSSPVAAGASTGVGAGGSGNGAGAGASSSGDSGASAGGATGSDAAGNGNGAGGASADGAGAGGAGEPACDPCPCSSGPFGAPELVAGLGIVAGNDAFGPAPSADGLTLYFSSIAAQEDILVSTRSTRANQFLGSELVPNVNDPAAADGTPFISGDDRALYFFSTRPDPDAAGDRDLWVASRARAGDPFSAPSLVPGVNTEGLEHLPRLTSDGLSLLFVSARPTVNLASNIWQADRALPAEPFSVPVELLGGVNSDGRDEGFWLSADGLTLFFASNREPEADMDLWVATRSDVSAPFGEPENLSVLNTPGIEIDPAVTLDGFELFFVSDRGGSMQLYRSARICE